jgi:hypothetical protein
MDLDPQKGIAVGVPGPILINKQSFKMNKKQSYL